MRGDQRRERRYGTPRGPRRFPGVFECQRQIEVDHGIALAAHQGQFVEARGFSFAQHPACGVLLYEIAAVGPRIRAFRWVEIR